MKKSFRVLVLIIVLTIVSLYIALPAQFVLNFNFLDKEFKKQIELPQIKFFLFGKYIHKEFILKKGLDIQGGMQVILKADMSEIEEINRETALESAKNIILKRVDLYGINEPVVQTAKAGEDDYRIIVELAGVDDPNQALSLVGKTAQLDFRLEKSTALELRKEESEFDSEAKASASASQASDSAELLKTKLNFFENFEKTELTGKELKKAQAQFDPQTGEPVVMMEFNDQGKELFAKITSENVGEVLAIFIDDVPVTTPRINTAILDGVAVISGNFDLNQAKELSIQLNAGAMPVPVEVLEQRTIGASLGELSVKQSIRAGVIGLSLVMLFMLLYYGWKGLVADLALLIYAILSIATYKVLGVTLTLPGIAGLILTIGMAVDANILIFERMKEELRVGQAADRALELGFGRAWDSIKDANLATILTALVLINPLNFRFLNSSGLVRGFGITLLIGVIISLFTGIVVTRTLMRILMPILAKKLIEESSNS
ncbi:MAG: protein translocase subunit SecD [Candidatus Woesebacteria bacterium]|jgi:preprotein translocase subunit SecD